MKLVLEILLKKSIKEDCPKAFASKVWLNIINKKIVDLFR